MAALSKKGDPLEAIATLVPWKSFRADIEAVALTPEAEKKSSAGRKPFDVILMFRMLILQSLYNLSDEQIEYQVRDRIAVIGGQRGGVQSRRRGVKCWLASPIVNRIWACSEGIAVSSGIARGVLAYADRPAGSLRRIEASQVEAEIARFETALEKTERDLLVIERYEQERIRPRESDIFTAQALVMRDPSIKLGGP